jgi:hypothetical protein
VLFVGLLWVFDAVSSRVQSVSQISALTERIEFTVTQPRLAAIPARQMRIGTNEPALDGKCIDGLVIPALHAKVVYGRVGYGPLSIRIVPPDDSPRNAATGEFDPSDEGRSVALSGDTYIETDRSCAENSLQKQAIADPSLDIPLPLPIWGIARVGSEFKGVESSSPDPRLLLSGQMKVSARAVEFPHGILGMHATLYPVAELDLPVGSRLEAYDVESHKLPLKGAPSADGAEFVPNWWGTAYVDSEKPGLNVELATDTPKLALFHPNQHEPDIIEVSRLNQIFEDPNLIKVYKLLGVLTLAAAFSNWLLKAIQTVERETEDKEANSK